MFSRSKNTVFVISKQLQTKQYKCNNFIQTPKNNFKYCHSPNSFKIIEAHRQYNKYVINYSTINQ